MQQTNILCVDDSPVNRKILGQLVTSLGFRPVEAESAQRALELLHDQDFELILLDLRLPDQEGSELLAQLKAQQKTQSIPVMMVSSAEDSQSVVTCLERGAEDYLIKPYEPAVLKARVRAVLERDRRLKSVRQGLFEGELLTRQAALEFLRRMGEASIRFQQPLTLVLWESEHPEVVGYLAKNLLPCDVACAFGRQQYLLGCPGRSRAQLADFLLAAQSQLKVRWAALGFEKDLETCLQRLDRELHPVSSVPPLKGRLF